MKKENKLEKMLDDIIRNDEVDDLREALHQRCRRELARKRRRKAFWIVPVAASLFVAFLAIHTWLLNWQSPVIVPEDVSKDEVPAYLIVSAPLSTQHVFTTSPISPRMVVHTTKPKDFLVQAVSSVHVVTGPARPVVRLTDEEVLGLFPETPCGLVNHEDEGKRLVFLHVEDEKQFFRPQGLWGTAN